MGPLRLSFAPLLAQTSTYATRSHDTKLLTRALFFGPCHWSYIFLPRLAFRVHVAGDLNETIPFVVDVLSTSFASTLLGLIHQSPSCLMQLSIFET